jgi:hypothetical protein
MLPLSYVFSLKNCHRKVIGEIFVISCVPWGEYDLHLYDLCEFYLYDVCYVVCV